MRIHQASRDVKLPDAPRSRHYGCAPAIGHLQAKAKSAEEAIQRAEAEQKKRAAFEQIVSALENLLTLRLVSHCFPRMPTKVGNRARS